MERMYEIDFELIEDGSIRLEQQSGVDEPNIIWLHPEQLKFIMRRTCGMNAATAAQVADLERKLAIICSDLEFIVTEKNLRRQIIDCDDGVELITRLDALLDLSMEFDGGRLLPRGQQEPQEASTDDSAGTPTPKPSTGTRSTTRRTSNEPSLFDTKEDQS